VDRCKLEEASVRCSGAGWGEWLGWGTLQSLVAHSEGTFCDSQEGQWDPGMH